MGKEIQNEVLVVDDNPEVLESISLMLINEGYSVTSCPNAHDALAKIQENSIDVVLSDIRMPDVSGIELLEKIHDVNSHLPVILMTAYADMDAAVNAISKGAFDLIIKPSPPDYVIHSLKKAIEHINYVRLKENYKLHLEYTIKKRTHALEKEVQERKRTEHALRQSEKQLRALASRLQEVEESERKGLARELHDRVGQTLTALNISLNIIRSQLSADSLKKVSSRLDDIMSLLAETTERIRDLMAELRPEALDDYGLPAALRLYCERFEKLTSLRTIMHGDNISLRLPETIEMACFRIVQEAMTNIAKHAEAGEVNVTFESTGDQFRLTVCDNGKGFDVSDLSKVKRQRGWGILTMQERAQAFGGNVRIESGPEKGTRVIIEVEI